VLGQTPEARIAALELELADTRSRMLRALADYQNMARRSVRDVADARQHQTGEVARELLEVLDHFDRALAVDASKVTAESLLTGVQLVRDELTKMLDRFDIRRFEPGIGDAFEPGKHEALMHQAVAGLKPDQVAAVLQPGYTIGDRTLRPAKVSVSQ
jgi:molecular chaperone GrpE